MLRMGVDIGSTHTDAVIVDEKATLLYAAKAVTTQDITSGVLNAMEKVIAQGVDPTEIGAVMLGTTHGLNAIIERKNLRR